MELTSAQFHRFQELIYSVTGIRVPDSKIVLLSNRLRRRAKTVDLASFDDYFRLVDEDRKGPEFTQFLNAVTTNETFFFRTEKHFEWFQSDFMNERVLLARKGGAKSLRVWSAACSTGEEVYSLAICVARNLLRLRNWNLEIIGTDLSEDVLQSARMGTYGSRSMEAVPDTQKRRYFTQASADSWTVRPSLKEFVTFQPHNLMTPMRLPPFDCIFIRNVLIYFDRESKQQVVQHLINALVPGGYLVVGPSEGIYDMLGNLKKHSTFLYQKET